MAQAALGAQVAEEPAVPVRARRVLGRQPFPADPLAQRPALADLVLHPAVRVELLLSRPSF